MQIHIVEDRKRPASACLQQFEKDEPPPKKTLLATVKPLFTDVDGAVNYPSSCTLCNISFSCLNNAKNHFNGEKHRKKVKLLQVKANPEQMLHVVTHPLQVKANPEQMLHVVTHPLQCDLCNVSLTDQMSAKVHFESLIHLNKVVYQQC